MSLEEQFAALSARLVDLEAKEQIRELFCTYGFAADTGSAREWVQTYAPDGVYDGLAMITGHDNFARSIDDPDGVHKQQIEGKGSLHTHGPVMIRVTGDQAWAEGPTLVWTRADEGSWRPSRLAGSATNRLDRTTWSQG